MTFGDASWGTIKLGRDLGIFGSDAILSDMTLLGVGVGAGGAGNTTLGRIGSGYVYADWKAQIAYSSPNWNGFSFSAAIVEPFRNDYVTYDSDNYNDKSEVGFEAKASYAWTGDFAGKVWVSAISQKHNSDIDDFDYTSRGWDIGANVNVAGFGLTGYYYDGKGLDLQTGGQLGGLQMLGGIYGAGRTDDDGGYVQATYTIPNVGTKLGASWGVSNSDVDGYADFENKSWVVGAYHPLTKSLNLVAEYTKQNVEDKDSNYEGEARTVSLGAILFF